MATCHTCLAGYPAGATICRADGTTLDGDPPAASRGEAAGDRLLGQTLAGRFTVTRRLGEGGMGAVYAARDTQIGREVAIKILHERHAERPDAAARLWNEARLAASIRHDHIVDIFDVGETADGRSFVVMELLDGESLAERLRRQGAEDERFTLEVARQIAGALAAAHARHVIHRDVKPENVLLLRRDGEPFVKLVDFGISKAARVGADGQQQSLTQTGVVVGTPLYLSPEQASGAEKIDPRVDVWALGVILYECLTGDVPFRAANTLGVIQEILHATPRRPRLVRPSISERTERVILRALAKQPEDRYPTMAALEEDLARLLAGEEPRPHGSGRRAGARTWLAIPLVVAVGGVIGLLALARLAPLPAALPPPPPAPIAPAAPALSPSVVVKIGSSPAGAEIRDGSRVLGITPAAIELARSTAPLELSFHLPGYAAATTRLVPQRDGERVEVALTRLPPPRPRPTRRAVAPPPPPVAGSPPARAESLPVANPYGAANP